MDNIYYLDLATLLKTLATVSATLIAELPGGVPGHAEPCKGYIRIHNKAITMSAIVSNGQVIAKGLQALQLLEKIEAWHISFSRDLPDSGGDQQASSSPSQSSQRSNSTPSRSPAKENQRYFPTPVQYSPTTGPLSQQPTPPLNVSNSPTTGSLSQQEISSAMKEPSPYMLTQYEMSPVNGGLIADSKVFQQRIALTSESLEKYSPKERLILRTVYSKINGQRRVDQLKGELRLPAATVERTLSELCRLGVID